MVGGASYPVSLEDLPTRVESFKSLDDTNLVKMSDVGQVGGTSGAGFWGAEQGRVWGGGGVAADGGTRRGGGKGSHFESFKMLDDAILAKMADVGQVGT